MLERNMDKGGKLTLALIWILTLTWSNVSLCQTSSSASKFEAYKEKFGVDCALEKVVDNYGNGNEDLYGTRNLRVVLHGVAYRGGANNYYHRSNKRNNKNPLPDDGLNNLCRNGFSAAVYLYSDRFETAPTSVTKGDNTLSYHQISGNDSIELKQILDMTYDAIESKDKGPIYFHCWNGWHQSGYVSAIMLRQFCGYSPDQALAYWEKGADKLSKGYTKIKDKIRAYEPQSGYTINLETKTAICPCYELKPSEKQALANKLTNIELETSVPFSTDNHELPPEASTFLDEYADLLQENPFVQLEIRGHTDVRGDVQTNQQLSLHRAEAVKNYLVSRGVDSLRLKTIGMGSQQPLNHCQTSANCPDSLHAKNRRAELKVTGITLELNFLLGSTAPTEQQAKTLKRLAELLKANPVLMVVIEGHTDTSGNSVKNQTISTLRAKTVFDLLASMGVNLFQMSYRGMGSTAPKYKDDRDRRVEFKIVSARQ